MIDCFIRVETVILECFDWYTGWLIFYAIFPKLGALAPLSAITALFINNLHMYIHYRVILIYM